MFGSVGLTYPVHGFLRQSKSWTICRQSESIVLRARILFLSFSSLSISVVRTLSMQSLRFLVELSPAQGPRSRSIPKSSGLCVVTLFYRPGLIKGRNTVNPWIDRKTHRNQNRIFSMLQSGPDWLATDGGIAPPRPLHRTFLHQSRLSPLRQRLGLRCTIHASHSALDISAWYSAWTFEKEEKRKKTSSLVQSPRPSSAHFAIRSKRRYQARKRRYGLPRG